MKYLLKQTITPLIYLVFCSMLGLSIMLLEENLLILEIALNIVNLAFYILILSATAYKDGQKALDVRELNDKTRAIIAQTGQDLELNVGEEYSVWKGFAYGALSCAPLVILLVIHTIVVLSGGLNTVGMIAGLIYMPVFSFFMLLCKATAGMYYLTLFAIPVISLTCGIAYSLGAKSAIKKYQAIEEQRRFLKGE